MHWVGGSVYFFQTWGSHRVGVYIVHLELFKTIASEVGLTEKINIALENVAVYTIALIIFCVWICTSVFCLCYPNIVKVSNFVRAKKLIWWRKFKHLVAIGLEILKGLFQLTSPVKCDNFLPQKQQKSLESLCIQSNCILSLYLDFLRLTIW